MTSRYLVPLLCLSSLSAQTGSDALKTIANYCSGCHDGRVQPSGVRLLSYDATQIAAQPEIWAKAYRQIQADAMPPAGARRPTRAESKAVLVSIEEALGAHAKPTIADSQTIATRLATLLWKSEPDSALLDEAKSNRLNDHTVLDGQIKRMLADNRAQAFISNFFLPWLQLDQLSKADPDKKYFPNYDISLRDSFVKETELFLLSQLRDDRNPIELWNANYTFLNEQLAKHYGSATSRARSFNVFRYQQSLSAKDCSVRGAY